MHKLASTCTQIKDEHQRTLGLVVSLLRPQNFQYTNVQLSQLVFSTYIVFRVGFFQVMQCAYYVLTTIFMANTDGKVAQKHIKQVFSHFRLSLNTCFFQMFPSSTSSEFFFAHFKCIKVCAKPIPAALGHLAE